MAVCCIICSAMACQTPRDKIEPTPEPRIFQYSDSGKKQSIQTIRQLPIEHWEEVESPNFGRKGGYGWVKFRLTATNDRPIWIEVQSHFIDTLSLFVTEPGKSNFSQVQSTFNESGKRPFNHRYFLFPLRLAARKPHLLFLKGTCRAPDVLKIPVRIWSTDEFIKYNQRDVAGWSLFVGFMLMAFILALMAALFFSNAMYLFFAVYTLFLTTYALSNDGWGALAPYPVNMLDDNIVLIHWLNLGLLFFILFSQRFLAVTPSSRGRRSLPWLILLGGESAILLTQVGQHHQHILTYTIGFYGIGYILLLYFPLWISYVAGAIRRKFKPVWIHLISIAFLISFFITGGLLVNSGLIKSHWSNMFLLRWAIVVDVVVILISWMYRNKLLERERQQLEGERRYHERLAAEAALRQREEEIRSLHLKNEIHQQRIRLARDLHDGLGSELTHIINRLDILSLRTDMHQPLESLSDFTRATNQNLRDTLWILNQESVSTEEWFDRTLQWLIKRWEDTDTPRLVPSYKGTSTCILNPTTSISLLRIAQEAANNALKYANATSFEFIFREKEECVEMAIQDDGRGFDKETVKRGYGLSNMVSRAEELSGTLSIRSSPGEGTRILLSVPIKKD